MRQQNFVVCEHKFTNFSAYDVELIVVVNAVFLLSISLIHSRDICDQILKLSKNMRTVDAG